MAQKINPNGLRYGINKNWNSRWIAKDNKQMASWLVEDEKIRKYLLSAYKQAQIVNIEIERTQKNVDVFVSCGQPGLIIGKEGANIPAVIKEVNKIVGRKIKVNVNVIAHINPATSARVIAREIADSIENRVSFRNAQKMSIRKALSSGALGIKTTVSGRLGGAEMAREEGYTNGVIPLTTLRADIDFAIEEAHTTYGIIGVKVWINRGEIFAKGLNNQVVIKPEKSFNDRKRNNYKNNRNNNFNKKPVSAVPAASDATSAVANKEVK